MGLTKEYIHRIVEESVHKVLFESLNSIRVYRGADENRTPKNDIWVTTDKRFAEYFAKQDYNDNGVVEEYLLPNSVTPNLCTQEEFEEIMNDYGVWQEVEEDSPMWENEFDEDFEYDLMHDLCFPSEEQKNILKREGYLGIIFEYETNVFSIMLFDASNLRKVVGK